MCVCVCVCVCERERERERERENIFLFINKQCLTLVIEHISGLVYCRPKVSRL